jgi:curved DNA-binding protein CbpA
MTLARALRVLDLHAAADRTEVKQAYLDLVRVWHPDRFQRDTRLRERATGRLAEINTAYALLSAPSRTAASRRAWGVTDPRTMRTNPSEKPGVDAEPDEVLQLFAGPLTCAEAVTPARRPHTR